MKTIKKAALAIAICMSASPPVLASGIPVVDVVAIAQSLQQLTQMLNQLQQLKNQLNQAKQQFDSLNGIRGMADLVNNPTARRYLPSSAAELYQLQNGVTNGQYNGLSGAISALKQANRVLDPSRLSADQAARLDASQNHLAMMQATAEQAYSAADRRFDDYQSMIEQLRNTPDPKSVYDLQARIQSEQVMMQNEQAKLQMLAAMASAKREAEKQQARERNSMMGGGTPVYPTSYRLPN